MRPGEVRALEDAMTLANLRAADLGGVPPATGAGAAQIEAMKDPVLGLGVATARGEGATGDEAALLRKALGLVGGRPEGASRGDVAEVPSAVPTVLRRPVGLLVAALARADDEIRASLASLSPDERRILVEALPRLAAEDPTLPLDFAHGPPPEFARVRALLDRVDAGRIERAGVALAATVREALPALRGAPKSAMKTVLFRSQGVLVELSGTGPDRHVRRDVGLCIDLGGDDRYTGRYAAGIGYASVLIDLSGNDRYFGPDASFGVGLLGIGLAYDLGGDDVYAVRSVGLGCGLAGVGMLSDATGDDRYRVRALGLGAAARGIGLVDDPLGDDAYDVERAGEGFGTRGGVGWCVDGAGDDVYRGGECVQATGRAGGMGLLSDLGGDDSYRAISGQAAAMGGYAALVDGKGDDDYVALGRAQGFASDGGFAALVDESGDDSYLLRRGPGQAAAFAAVAILADREGNDVYGGTEGAPAAAFGGGLALLLESEGDDRYLAAAPFARTGDGVALWADGGGRDRYGDGRLDAQAEAAEGRAALDAGGFGEESATARKLPEPGSIPLPSAAELAELRRRATDGPDAPGAVARLVGIGVPALEALAGDEAFTKVAAAIGAPAAPTVARLVRSSDPRVAAAALATAGFVPLPPDAVIAALERPELRLAALRAAGAAKTAEAVPTLTVLAASPERPVARAAIEALSSIGDPSSVGTASALVDSPDLEVRRAAFRLLTTQPTAAYSTATRLVASEEGFRKRIGLALLGALGTPQALQAAGPSLRGDRNAKIGALLALDGRVPIELIATIEALRRDPDPLVRAVAERTDAGP